MSVLLACTFRHARCAPSGRCRFKNTDFPRFNFFSPSNISYIWSSPLFWLSCRNGIKWENRGSDRRSNGNRKSNDGDSCAKRCQGTVLPLGQVRYNWYRHSFSMSGIFTRNLCEEEKKKKKKKVRVRGSLDSDRVDVP